MTSFDKFLISEFGSLVYKAIKNDEPKILENCFDDIVELPQVYNQRLLNLCSNLRNGPKCKEVMERALNKEKSNDFTLLTNYLISSFKKNINTVFLYGSKIDKEKFKQQLAVLPFDVQTEVIEWIQKQYYGDLLFSGNFEL